jgi:hypothetical protein
MDVRPIARWATASERRIDMADLRKCIGSAKFGIEAHEAPIADFPVQASQRDGLGRMCKPHWNQYTAALARDRKARLAVDAGVESPVVAAARKEARAKAKPAKKPEPIRTKPARGRKTGAALVAEIVDTADAALARGEADVEEISVA